MVNNRTFVPQSSTSIEASVRGRYYPANPFATTNHARPRQIVIRTRQPSFAAPLERYAFAENHLSFNILQPYVHNCVVVIQERCNTYHFMVFFKRHRRLPPNICLQHLNRGPADICSDIVAIRIGVNAAYVNMRGRDTAIADWMMRRLSQMNLLARRRLPAMLALVKD